MTPPFSPANLALAVAPALGQGMAQTASTQVVGGFVGIDRHDVAIPVLQEEWIVPVDSALEAAGGVVFRRSRSDVAKACFDHNIAACRAELKSLEAESSQATGKAQDKHVKSADHARGAKLARAWALTKEALAVR